MPHKTPSGAPPKTIWLEWWRRPTGYQDLKYRLAPNANSGFYKWITAYGNKLELQTRFLELAQINSLSEGIRLSHYRPTLLGILFLCGVVVAWTAIYRPILGVWVLIFAIYLLLVFCVGGLNSRFILPAEPFAYLLALLPFDVLFRSLSSGPGNISATERQRN
jgi:hypothetical protein